MLDNSNNSLRIRFHKSAAEVELSQRWLHAHRYDRSHSVRPGHVLADLELWSGNSPAAPAPINCANRCDDDQALRAWLDQLARFGFAQLSDDPIR